MRPAQGVGKAGIVRPAHVVPNLEKENRNQLREIGKRGVVPRRRKLRPAQGGGSGESRSCTYLEKEKVDQLR